MTFFIILIKDWPWAPPYKVCDSLTMGLMALSVNIHYLAGCMNETANNQQAGDELCGVTHGAENG